ncbi:MAG TPA: hypothetical protein VIU15_03515 [Streptomyces sp.]
MSATMRAGTTGTRAGPTATTEQAAADPAELRVDGGLSEGYFLTAFRALTMPAP